MREQPKVWCDAACGAQVGPYPTALAAEVAAETHETACAAGAELKNPPMSTPAAQEPGVGETWRWRGGAPFVVMGRHEPYPGWDIRYQTGGVGWFTESAWKDGEMALVSRAACVVTGQGTGDPAPAVGQRRQWETEPYIIVGEDRSTETFLLRFDSDRADEKPAVFERMAVACDRYLGEAPLCGLCRQYVRPGEVHINCERSRKETAAAVQEHTDEHRRLVAEAASTCPNCGMSEGARLPDGHICAPKPPRPARLTATAVAKAPGARDWMMGLRDDWDNLPDA